MTAAKKLAFWSVIGMLAVGASIGGATYALFTDSVSNADNSFTAGTIVLSEKRDHGDYVPGPMFYPDVLDEAGNHPYDDGEYMPSGEAIGGWAPGDTVRRTMILTNEGTLDARIAGIKATVRSTYTHNLPDGSSVTVSGETSGPAYEEFIQKAHVKVTNPDSGVMLYDGSLASLLGSDYQSVLNELILTAAAPPFSPGPLNITFEVTLDKSAGNAIQGKNFIFDFGFLAEQVRNNP